VENVKIKNLQIKKLLRKEQNVPFVYNTYSGNNACELRCNHVYHKQCILWWLENTKTCPLCRQHVMIVMEPELYNDGVVDIEDQ
jgi:hypothetical protein